MCRATAGVATPGSGRVISILYFFFFFFFFFFFRPGAGKISFIAQRPYLPPGPLRWVLEGATHPNEGPDDRIFALLRELNLEQIVRQAGGLDAERDWGTLFSLSEQQLLALVHILLAAPQFVFLDRLDTTLSSDQVHKILRMLAERSVTYVNIGPANESPDLYDAVLECCEDGAWVWTAEPAAHSDADAPRGRA